MKMVTLNGMNDSVIRQIRGIIFRETGVLAERLGRLFQEKEY
jgi:hypothetical protein